MEAYEHQVGGHTRFMKPIRSSKVYKPFESSEYRFYESLQAVPRAEADQVRRPACLQALDPLSILRRFVPAYFGVTEVQVVNHGASFAEAAGADGGAAGASGAGVPVDAGAAASSTWSCVCGADTLAAPRRRRKNSGDDAAVAAGAAVAAAAASAGAAIPAAATKATGAAASAADRSAAVASRLGAAAGAAAASGGAGAAAAGAAPAAGPGGCSPPCGCVHRPLAKPEALRYIVLEDLVYNYKRPCVMDLKIGTRQRKVGASQAKVKRQLEKSFQSTSHNYGFRLCGSQSFNRRKNAFLYRDKYWGQKLTARKLLPAIRSWFFDGSATRFDVVALVLQELHLLRFCLSRIYVYRFWSSSLLWVFDGGGPGAAGGAPAVRVKMIDFANTIVLPDSRRPDVDYLYGLTNLIQQLELCLVDAETRPPLLLPKTKNEVPAAAPDEPPAPASLLDDERTAGAASDGELCAATRRARRRLPQRKPSAPPEAGPDGVRQQLDSLLRVRRRTEKLVARRRLEIAAQAAATPAAPAPATPVAVLAAEPAAAGAGAAAVGGASTAPPPPALPAATAAAAVDGSVHPLPPAVPAAESVPQAALRVPQY